jgi:uncharacterized damage-inducible protein DinB
MTTDSARIFLDYSCERFARELERVHLCFDQIDDSDAWRHPAEGCNSIGNIVVHLCGNIGQWMTSVANGQADTRDRHNEFIDRSELTKADLLAKLDETVEAAVSTIRGLDPTRLPERLVIQDFDVSVLTAIFETERHFAEHVGQIAFITKMLRGRSFRPLWVPKTPAQRA